MTTEVRSGTAGRAELPAWLKQASDPTHSSLKEEGVAPRLTIQPISFCHLCVILWPSHPDAQGDAGTKTLDTSSPAASSSSSAGERRAEDEEGEEDGGDEEEEEEERWTGELKKDSKLSAGLMPKLHLVTELSCHFFFLLIFIANHVVSFIPSKIRLTFLGTCVVILFKLTAGKCLKLISV